jgi:hypothetical protein
MLMYAIKRNVKLVYLFHIENLRNNPYRCRLTTPLNSFTDGLIPLVTRMNSVGEIFTDGLTDRTRLSV